MKKYYEEIPLVIRNCIKGLSDENRQSILIYLLNEGTKSFIDIHKKFDSLSKSNLAHHLKVLLRYGLIYNYYNKNQLKDRYSFYIVSNLGEHIIFLLIKFPNSINPDLLKRIKFRRLFKEMSDDLYAFTKFFIDLHDVDTIDYVYRDAIYLCENPKMNIEPSFELSSLPSLRIKHIKPKILSADEDFSSSKHDIELTVEEQKDGTI